MDQICSKWVAISNLKHKIDTTTEFCKFESVSLLLWTNNFEFLDQICPRRIFMVKNRRSEHHWIPHFQIILGTKFEPKLTILIFSTRFAQKKFFWFKTEKSGRDHWILYSQISAKFQLKLTILSFWTKFTQKCYFQLKTEQAVQALQAFAFCVVKVNLTVVFEHFEDLRNLIILNISKEKLVISCLLGSFYIIIA